MANALTPFIPQWWANETVALLYEKMSIANLVHRDFEMMFNQYGDTVNTRQPARMNATRKAPTTDVTPADISATNIPVKLNQQIVMPFVVSDLDMTKSFKDLIVQYIQPAAMAIARKVDRITLAAAAQIILSANIAGRNDQSVYANIVDTGVKMDNQFADEDGRNMILSPRTRGTLLKDPNLFRAEAAGTQEVVIKGRLGELSNFQMYKGQNTSDLPVLLATGNGVVPITYPAIASGAISFSLAAQTSPTLVAGQWISIFGQPFKIASVSGSGPYLITLGRVIPFDVPVNTVGYSFRHSPFSTSYAVGYEESIVLTPTTNSYVPVTGQYVEIAGKLYGVIDVPASNTIVLDRALEDAVTSSDLVQSLPSSNYSLAFYRDAITLAVRPLAPVMAGAGAVSSVASANGLAVRVTMGYNMTKQYTQITMDLLMGYKVLNADLATVMVA